MKLTQRLRIKAFVMVVVSAATAVSPHELRKLNIKIIPPLNIFLDQYPSESITKLLTQYMKVMSPILRFSSSLGQKS